eukprot:m.200167 g.200167  ORF g.200167 m.200167 type:complete len:318 (-) comp20975_c0_seq1:92-1045(-)
MSAGHAAVPPASDRITAHVTGDVVAVWSVDEATRIRTEHHIVGAAVGALAHHSQQNMVLGLPVVLSPEEVALLSTKDAIQFIDLRGPRRKPSGASVELFRQDRERYLEVQAERLRRNAEERRAAIDAIRRLGKRRKTAVDKQPEASAACTEPSATSVAPATGASSTTATGSGASGALHQAARVAILTAGTYGDAATELLDHLPLLPSEIELPLRYNVAASDVLRRRCRVVADLHAKGYWITAGVKFGGDFLVYPGDPHRYHSHFVAVVVEPEQPITPHDIVSFGRLVTVVKKALILCTVTPSDEVEYVTALWTGSSS